MLVGVDLRDFSLALAFTMALIELVLFIVSMQAPMRLSVVLLVLAVPLLAVRSEGTVPGLESVALDPHGDPQVASAGGAAPTGSQASRLFVTAVCGVGTGPRGS